MELFEIVVIVLDKGKISTCCVLTKDFVLYS